MSSIYRQSKLGDSLVEALDVMITQEKITPDLAYKVLGEFDSAMVNALATKVNARATFKGHLDTYRFCDNVWTFVLSNASFKTSGAQMYSPDIVVDKVKIVCVDSRFVEVNSANTVKTEPQ